MLPLLAENSSPSMVDKGKSVSVPLRSKFEGVNSPRRQPSQRFVPTCYHCGRGGHIRPHYFKFRSREPKKESAPPRTKFEKLFYIIKDMVSRLDKKVLRVFLKAIGTRLEEA